MADVKKVKLKSQIVLGIREIGSYTIIPELIKKIYPYTKSRSIDIGGPAIFICHETAEQAMTADKQGKADVEVCVPIKERIKIDAEGMELGIACYEIPGGTFAKTTHKGPYEQCKTTYNEIFNWIYENRYRITGPTREYYLNNPKEVKPEEIKTEIYAPIQKIKETKKLTKEVK